MDSAHEPLPDGLGEADDEAWVDAYITRNREVLIESIRKARAEVAAGNGSTRTIDEIIQAARLRHGRA
jgi:hypothetical protein